MASGCATQGVSGFQRQPRNHFRGGSRYMTATAYDGPLSIIGQRPTFLGPTSPTGAVPGIRESNPDLAPALIHGGAGLRDPRMLPHVGQGPQGVGGIPNQDCGWYMAGGGGL